MKFCKVCPRNSFSNPNSEVECIKYTLCSRLLHTLNSFAVNQGNHQNFDPSLIPKSTTWQVAFTDFHGDEANFFFLKTKFQNGRLKKTEFFKIANSQIFFVKILWIGPWVRRIDWCEGLWCGSTYMIERLFDVSSKTGKKCIFCCF